MAATKEYSEEELNYFRSWNIATRILPDGLRAVFKQEWDRSYKLTHGEWLDTAQNGKYFYSMESSRNRKAKARELAIMINGNTVEWDCTCLFHAILYSTSISRGLAHIVRKSVDALRRFRNLCAHKNDGKFAEKEFRAAIETVIVAFTDLKLDTTLVQEIKSQKSFPTEEVRNIRQELEKERKINEEPHSFYILPPKPSHDTIDRLEEVTNISEEMEQLNNKKANEITVIYLSGNPGCGKSEVARQIAENKMNTFSSKKKEVNFVVTLNASSLDTLIQSYIEFAISLKCDKDYITEIERSKNLSQEKKLIRLKSLVFPQVQKYSSWLMIIDNVIDLKSVSKYWPQAGEKILSGSGQILVTTQDSQSIAVNSHTYHLSLSRGMKKEEAVKVLTEISGMAYDEEVTPEIAQTLDFQPLALACAGIYMRHVSSTVSSMSWKKYLQKILDGKRREATEKVYVQKSLTYPTAMTTAVRMAIENVTSRDKVMEHALQFLSVMAPEPISLIYVVQYVMGRMRDEDEELVAAHIRSSSFILTSENEPGDIHIHQVVYYCIQNVLNNERAIEFGILSNVVEAFSPLISFDIENLEIFSLTRSLVKHLLALTTRLKYYIENRPSAQTIEENLKAKYHFFLSCLFRVGRICRTHGVFEAARICLEISLMIQKVAYGENHPTVTTTLNYFGHILRDLGKYEEAKSYLEKALAIIKSESDKNHPTPTHSETLSNLGVIHRILGHYEKAKSYQQKAVMIDEAAYGKDHPSVAKKLNNLGLTLRDLGKYQEAKECFERDLAISENAPNKPYQTVVTALNNLGLTLCDLGIYVKSKERLERALFMAEVAVNKNHPAVATILSSLGNTLRDLAKYEEAKGCLERALAIRESTYEKDHPGVAVILNDLGLVLRDLGQCKIAKEYLERALTIRENAKDKNDSAVGIRLAVTLNDLGMVLRDLGQLQEAKSHLERALAIREIAYDKDHPALAITLNDLGMVLRDLGQLQEAKSHLERALAIKEIAYDKDHPALAITLNDLGMVLRDLGQLQEAKNQLERALAIKEIAYDKDHPALAITLNNLGMVLRDQAPSKLPPSSPRGQIKS